MTLNKSLNQQRPTQARLASQGYANKTYGNCFGRRIYNRFIGPLTGLFPLPCQ
jgi:hypothetical protein